MDVLPVLKYLPEWFPGAGFQKEAKEWKKTLTRFVEEPFKAVKQGMVSKIYFNVFQKETYVLNSRMALRAPLFCLEVSKT